MAPLLLVGAVLAAGLVLAGGGRPAWAAPDAVRLDSFQRTYPPGSLPDTWELHKIAPLLGSGDDEFYQFVNKSGSDGHYIHLRSGADNSFSIGYRQKFRLQDWPILEWQWKVTRTPKGGDVRVKARDDQAGSMCVIVNPGLFGFYSLCYLWENAGPKDTPITSTKRDDSRYLILRTVKDDGVGRWYSEKRNVLKDYIRVFGHPPQQEAVIGMQIDSDSTESSGEVFYRDIYRRKQ